MDIRWRMRARPNTRCAVVALVVGIAEKTIESEKSASFVRRRLLSIDLLKADHVGCKFSHDRPENGHTMCELCFMPSRPSKIFQIERRDTPVALLWRCGGPDIERAVRRFQSPPCSTSWRAVGHSGTPIGAGPFVLRKVGRLGTARRASGWIDCPGPHEFDLPRESAHR